MFSNSFIFKSAEISNFPGIIVSNFSYIPTYMSEREIKKERELYVLYESVTNSD